MVNEPFAPGTEVIVWGRPETNLILLFGEGRYEGTTYINGNYWPTIRLNNGRELTVHQQGILIGRAEAVGKSCKAFPGDVIEWDLDAFLRGEKPTVEQRVKSAPNGNSSALPPPKTATDKVMFLKQEIEMQENKKKVAEKVIADADAIIAAKRKEIGDTTQAVLAELANVNPDILKLLAAQVAEQMKNAPPQSPAPTLSAEDMLRPIGGPPASPVVQRAVITQQPDQVEVDHTKLATED